MPFAPVVAIDLSTPAPKAVPAITATVTQATGESTIATLGVEFPRAFGYNEGFTAARCQPVEEAAEACPEASRIGTVSATSPIAPAEGSVYITDDFRIVAFAEALGGLISIKVDGAVTVAPAGGFAITFSGLPDLPLSSVKLALDAGNRGVLKSPARCATYTLPVQFTAHDGSAATAAPEVAIAGCAPPAPVRAVTARKGIVTWKVAAGTQATRLTLKRGSRTVSTRRVVGTQTAFKGLDAGRYRVTLRALAAGLSSRPSSATFRIR